MKQPYIVNIDPSILDDLHYRLAITRWTNDINNDKWETGTNLAYLKELCSYWHQGFNWQKNEAYLNSFFHFKTTIDNTGIHFIHEKGKGEKRIPLLLIHGFPDSFTRFLKVMPLLTETDSDGFSFDLIIPSLPGFGFSEIPAQPGYEPCTYSLSLYKTDDGRIGLLHIHRTWRRLGQRHSGTNSD